MRKGGLITRSRDLRLFSRSRRGRVVCGLCLVAGAIAGLPTPAQAAFTFYTDAAAFQSDLSAAGLFVESVWDFGPHNLNPGDSRQFDDLLNINTHNLRTDAWSSPADLWPTDFHNVTFSSNTTPGAGFAPNDPGNNGMDYQAGTPWGNLLLSKTKEHSFDILIGEAENYPAMWVNLVSLGFTDPTPVFNVTAYDQNDAVMGTYSMTGTAVEGQGTFLGMLTDAPTIGRVDIWVQTNDGGFEGISSIAVYRQIPGPGCLALLGLAAQCLRRRRRA